MTNKWNPLLFTIIEEKEDNLNEEILSESPRRYNNNCDEFMDKLGNIIGYDESHFKKLSSRSVKIGRNIYLNPSDYIDPSK